MTASLHPGALEQRPVMPESRHPRVFATGDIERLADSPTTTGRASVRRLSARLRDAYDGDLAISLRSDRPTVIANFVSTLDGAVALAPGTRSGGGDVSDHDPSDRFVMGLLRGLSDVVLVGAGTVRASKGAGWTATGVDDRVSADLADLRHELGLSPQPTTLVATQRGDLDPAMPAFRSPRTAIVIAAPEQVAIRLGRRGFPSHVRIAALSRDPERSVEGLMETASELGAGLVLSEAGPHLATQLVAGGWLDELFLTLAPRLVGRDEETPRLALLEGVALWPSAVREGQLLSVRRAADAVFLRYRLKEVPHD